MLYDVPIIHIGRRGGKTSVVLVENGEVIYAHLSVENFDNEGVDLRRKGVRDYEIVNGSFFGDIDTRKFGDASRFVSAERVSDGEIQSLETALKKRV